MKIDNFLDKEKSPDKATTACSSQPNVAADTYLVQTTLNSGIEFLPDQKLRNLLENSDNSCDPLPVSKTQQNGSLLTSLKVNKKLADTKRNTSKKRKLFLCSECNLHFNLKSHLFRHFYDVHKKFTCLYCCGLFLDGHSLEKHLVKKHDVQKNVFYDEKMMRYFLSANMMPVDSASKVLHMICCECGALLDLNNRIEDHPCKCKATSTPETAIMYQPTPEVMDNHAPPNLGFVEVHQPPEPPPTPPSEPPAKLVPKITLRIPRAFQNFSSKPMESDEDSGDEMSDSDDNSKEYDSFAKSNDSSFSDHENDEKINTSTFLPSLKLKIKNLGSSNPESFLENLPQLMESQQTTTTTQSVEHDLIDNNEPEEQCKSHEVFEPSEQQQQQVEELERFEPEEEMEMEEEEDQGITIDGMKLIPAGDDVLTIEISLSENILEMPIIVLLKSLLRSSFKYCLYCNHARKIVVNGRALALHFITSHRFNISFVSDDEKAAVSLETLVLKIQNHVKELDNTFFNLDTYDNTNHEMIEGHVTISHDKLYECFQCRFQTPIHKELYLHNRKMHQKSLISCLMCKTPFYSYSELLCHICPGVAHKQGYMDFKFYCCLCNLNEIPSAFRLMIHLRKKHFACDVCLEKCSDQAKLSSHVWKHKLFHLCYRCNICYRSKADITKHLFWKHGTQGIECRKCLQKKWPHVYHFCAPPSEFKCNQCEKVFSKAISLKVHMRLHEEDGAKYECTELECEKKFIAKKLLIRHLERHKIEKMTEEEQKEVYKSTIIVPVEIPEGCCTRAMPIVFNRLSTRALQNKVKKTQEEVPKVKEPVEETITPPPSVENTKKPIDIPKSELNLSESSDSDSDSSSDSDTDKKVKQKNSIESLAARLEAELDEDDLEPEKDLKEQATTSEAIVDEKKVKEPEKKHNSDQQDWEEVISEVSSNKHIVNPEVKDKVKIHVCQSDHDYAELCYTDEHKNVDEYAKKVVPFVKNTAENPFAEFSSSSSSDSSDSSSNSSSSSSSSSGTSTETMSSSEASTAKVNEKNKKRNKKFTKKRQKKAKQQQEEPPVPEEPRDPDLLIYDSDLLTNESDTDEDFYDEHPLKLDSDLSEKRKMLSKGDIFDGIVENSRPSTPSLPEEERITKKQKKKRKQHKKNKLDKTAEFQQLQPQEANQIRNLLQNQFAPSLNNDFINVSQVPSKASSATSSRMNSDSENPPNIKRSQRKRVPNKFYGYTSGDESLQIQLNDPFRPIPPPQLTWRKEDLPEKNKSQPSTPKVAPFKLNLTNDHLQQQLHSFAVDHTARFLPSEYHDTTMITPKSAHTSTRVKASKSSFDFNRSMSLADERTSTPISRKKDHENSMYAFHTLETPPAVESNPPLKFKLKLNNSKLNNSKPNNSKLNNSKLNNSKVNPQKRKNTTPKTGNAKVPKISTLANDVVKKAFNGPKFMGQKNGSYFNSRIAFVVRFTYSFFFRKY